MLHALHYLLVWLEADKVHLICNPCFISYAYKLPVRRSIADYIQFYIKSLHRSQDVGGLFDTRSLPAYIQ